MSDVRLIEIKARSKSGQIVTFHVAELLEIDGQPVRPEQQTLLTNILTRLERLEATEKTHA